MVFLKNRAGSSSKDPKLVCSRLLEMNRQQTYKRSRFMLDGWEVHSYTTTPFLSKDHGSSLLGLFFFFFLSLQGRFKYPHNIGVVDLGYVRNLPSRFKYPHNIGVVDLGYVRNLPGRVKEPMAMTCDPCSESKRHVWLLFLIHCDVSILWSVRFVILVRSQ